MKTQFQTIESASAVYQNASYVKWERSFSASRSFHTASRLVRQHGHISQTFVRIKCNVTSAPHKRNVRNGLAAVNRKKVQPCGCISAILASTSRCLSQANVECNFRKTDVCSAPGYCARSALARRSIRRLGARKADMDTDSKIAEMAHSRIDVV